MPGLYGITSNANISVYNTVGLYNVGNTNVAIKGNVTVSNTLGLYQGLGNPIILTNAQQLYTLLDESGNVQFALTNSNTTIKAFTANINTPTGTFGNGLTVPVITTSADGRVTNISQVAITGFVGQYSNANVAAYLPVNSANVAAPFFLGNGKFLSGLPASSVTLTGDVTGAGNTGTPFATALSATGVVGGTYGSEIFVPQITVDSKGRVTTIANVIVSPGGYGNSNVAAFLPTYGGTINTTTAFSNAGIALQGTTWSQLQWTNGGAVPADQTILGTGAWFYVDPAGGYFESNATGTLQSVGMTHTGNLIVSNSVITTYGVFWANGDVYGGSTYGNSNVAAYLASGTDATINAINANITAANATANSQIASTNANVTAVNVAISNLQANVYSNANVAAYLPINSANVAGQFFLGNAFYMTGVGAITYSNANVQAFLPTYTGTLSNSSTIVAFNQNINTANIAVYNLQQQIGTVSNVGNVGPLSPDSQRYGPTFVANTTNGYRYNIQIGIYGAPGYSNVFLPSGTLVANLMTNNGAVVTGNIVSISQPSSGSDPFTATFDINKTIYPWFDNSTIYFPLPVPFETTRYANVYTIATQSNSQTQATQIINLTTLTSQIQSNIGEAGPLYSNIADIGTNSPIFQNYGVGYWQYTLDIASANNWVLNSTAISNLQYANGYVIGGNVISVAANVPSVGAYRITFAVNETVYPWFLPLAANTYTQNLTKTVNTTVDMLAPNALTQSMQITSLSANASLVPGITANLAAANAQIAINTANISTLFTNAASQATAINSINANVTAANSAITVLQSNVVNITSNLGSSTASGNIGVVGSNRPVSISGNTWTIDATGNSTVLTTLSVNNLTTVNGYPINGNVTSIAANTPSAGVYRLTFTVSNVVYPWANSSIFPNSSIYANVQLGNVFVSNAAAQSLQMADFQTYANATFGAGSYGNANVAAYLPTYTGTLDNSSTIVAINANVTAANSAISTLQTNAATQATQINSTNANVTAANASIQTLNANVGAFQTYANATFYQSGSTITAANVSSINGYFWSNGVAYSTGGGSSTYSNSNVASYLPTTTVNFGGNLNNSSASNSNISMFAGSGIIDARLTTGAFILPTGANTARPSSPVAGMIRFNSNLGNPEWYSNVNSAWYTFSSNVSPPPSGTYTMTYLTVAGGGGGGSGQSSGGGGGGAGGLLIGNATVTAGTVYTVTVGNGGAGVAYTSGSGGGTGGQGGNSSITGSGFSSVIAIGGGGGGGNNGPGPTVAGSGGSGGGVPNYNGSGTSPGSGTVGQGNAGGNAGAGSPNYPSGGGGGAGAVGGNPPTNADGGPGGAGSASTITGASVTYAGGGGGAFYYVGAGAIGAGGAGGGGSGGNGNGGTASTAGTANTGGGGGGNNQNSGSSSAGGSGVVILSVPTASYSGTYTGTVTVTTTGSNTILQFNDSGTYTA
jgi:uncharacterized coiled-coil protein SlyX